MARPKWRQLASRTQASVDSFVAPVLVTGVAGFVGHATAHCLLARGEQVVGTDIVNEYYDPALKVARRATFEEKQGFRFEKMDIAGASVIADLKRVVHLAAQAGVRYSMQNPFAYQHFSLAGHLSVMEACRHASGFKHLVYGVSSG